MAAIYDKRIALKDGTIKIYKQIVYWCPKQQKNRARTYKDHDQARRELKKLQLHEKQAIDADIDLPSKYQSRVTFSQVIARYIDDTEAGRDGSQPAERTTISQYRGHLKNHIHPRIGDKDALTFSTQDAKDFRDVLLMDFKKAGKSRALADKIMHICRASYSYHHPKWNIKENPFEKARLKKCKRRRDDEGSVDAHEIHTEEEFAKIRKTLENKQIDLHTREQNSITVRAWQRAEIYVLLGFLCGMRASEIRGLEKRHVNFVDGCIRIDQRVDAYGDVGFPKSGQAYRDIPCPPLLLAKIDNFMSSHNHEQVLPTDRGGYMSHTNFTKRFWMPLLSDADVRYRKFHFTRHYYASRLIELNVNLKLLTNLIGHHSFSFTERVYGRLIERNSTKDERKALAARLIPPEG